MNKIINILTKIISIIIVVIISFVIINLDNINKYYSEKQIQNINEGLYYNGTYIPSKNTLDFMQEFNGKMNRDRYKEDKDNYKSGYNGFNITITKVPLNFNSEKMLDKFKEVETRIGRTRGYTYVRESEILNIKNKVLIYNIGAFTILNNEIGGEDTTNYELDLYILYGYDLITIHSLFDKDELISIKTYIERIKEKLNN